MATKTKRTIVRGNVIENPPPTPAEQTAVVIPAVPGETPVAPAIAPIDITVEMKDGSPAVASVSWLGAKLVVSNKYQVLFFDADRNLPITIRVTQG